MKCKSLLCLLLAALTILPLFAACQDTTSNPSQTTDNPNTDPSTTIDPSEDFVPDLDFKEHEFVIAAPTPVDWGPASYDREELTNDALNDAIYNRNRQLEARFNITIRSEKLGSTGTQATQFMPLKIAGEDKIDIIAVGFYQSGKPLITENLILPWNGVEYINLDRDWWNKSVSKTLSILGNYYLIVGDVNWYTMKETAVCYFNKNVAEEYKTVVGDLYQTVRDHKWTFDQAHNIAKQISKDNGDGVWDTKDTYGAIQNAVIGATGFIYAAGYQTVYSTKDGMQLNFMTQKMQDLINYIYTFCFENNTSFTEASGYISDTKGFPIFFDDRALLMFNSMRHAETFRGYDSDFGIIPYPLYDETQKEYTTYCDQWGLACAMPSTATNPTRTGAILEAMSALSRKDVVPAYYEKTLMGKIKRDDESEEMLNIIFSNILYDVGICYCTDLDFVIIESLVRAKSNNLASWYRMRESKLKANYDELYEHVKKNIEQS